MGGFLFLVFILAGCKPQAKVDPANETTGVKTQPPKDSLVQLNNTTDGEIPPPVETDGDLVNTRNVSKAEGEVFTVVDKMPEFPGGDSGWNTFIAKNVHYPQIAIDNDIQGKVWIGFVVDKLGNVRDAEIERGIGGGCDEEALRVIQQSPRWKPGQLQGKNVNVHFRMPVNFRLK